MGALDYFDWCAITVLFGVIKLLVLEVKNLEPRRPLTLFIAAGIAHEDPPHSPCKFSTKKSNTGSRCSDHSQLHGKGELLLFICLLLNCPARNRGLQQADSVAQDNENGHRGDIADEDLPDFIPNFPLYTKFPLAGFFGHEPSGKNRDENSAEG